MKKRPRRVLCSPLILSVVLPFIVSVKTYPSHVGIRIRETALPVRPDVAGMCELLGLDPLYIANEGKLLAFVPAEAADSLLNVMRSNPLGKEACIIGEVLDGHPGRVILETAIGGSRIVDMLTGEQLPRIC